MNEGEAPPVKPGIKPRNAARVIIAIAFSISLVLSVMTGLNYTDIVKSKTLSHVITTDNASVTRDGGGNITSLNMTMEFTIANPGGKTIRAWIITYKGWLRDLPYELGLDSSRRTVDGSLVVNGVVQRYFPIFVASYSFDTPKVQIPPGANITITRHITVDWATYPEIMDGIAAIYGHGESTGAEPEWLHYTSALMFIETADLQVENPRAALIRWYDGVDITQGVGGAGP